MDDLLSAILQMSLGGSLLALLILGARALIGRRPGPFMPLLYAFLMLRLAFPFSIQCPLSIQNLLSMPETQTVAVAAQTNPVAADTGEIPSGLANNISTS